MLGTRAKQLARKLICNGVPHCTGRSPPGAIPVRLPAGYGIQTQEETA